VNWGYDMLLELQNSTFQKLPIALDKNTQAADQKANLRPWNIVSLFSGCGGMDLGFSGGFNFLGQEFDRLPFSVIWANDLNPEACKTYRHNLKHNIRTGSIWDYIDDLPAAKDVDVVIGGFPCQDISVNGKMAGVNGARSGLYRAMVEVVRRTKPKIFVAENVKGLLMRNNAQSLACVVRDFEALGYKLDVSLYHAADYGVPQSRERVFIVGTAPGIAPYSGPEKIHSTADWISAMQAIDDLKNMTENSVPNHIWSKAKSSAEQGNRRLIADRVGYTIRAECHGNIQYHYDANRRISMREAARIQSFPDNFEFMSKLRETERQIGNAVPPVLAWHIAQSIDATLKST
jgi:DNA (cytosine-5)-methyltransferase 1